jgi:hypothetical protein
MGEKYFKFLSDFRFLSDGTFNYINGQLLLLASQSSADINAQDLSN